MTEIIAVSTFTISRRGELMARCLPIFAVVIFMAVRVLVITIALSRAAPSRA